MTREAVKGHASGGPSGYSPDGSLIALVVSGHSDAWLLPDDPFLNAGCKVVRATGLAESIRLCNEHSPRLVFLPLGLDGESALPQLRHCLANKPPPVVVVVAANDQINAAAEAMRAGAYDCLFKPFSPARLAKTIQGALKSVPRPPAPTPAVDAMPGARASVPGSRGAIPPVAQTATTGADAVLGASPQMRDLLDTLGAVARTSAPVFLTGEVGTGKSMLARLVHDWSSRSQSPFVTLDCATITAGSEPNVLGPDGALARAGNGTVFLDEICELDPDLQARLLHIIETAEPGQADDPGAPPRARLITATRQDPHIAMQAGTLRADLYYRLNVAPVEIPPLRARAGDVALIARTKLGQYARTENRDIAGFSDAALDLMITYDWPGNLRELLNVVWTAVLLHQGPLVTPEHLPAELRRPPRTRTHTDVKPAAAPRDALTAMPPQPDATGAAGSPEAPNTGTLVGRSLAEIERAVIEATIRAEGGSIPRAARILDVSPSTLYRKREGWDRSDAD